MDDNSTTSLISHNVMELEESIQEAKDLEKRGSFKRVSPELFVKIVGFCDSPSLMKFSRVSKQFDQSILANEELFRSFTTTGSSYQILRGLDFFGKKCNNSIHSVKLEVQDVKSLWSFGPILSRYKSTLRSIEVAHQGDLGYELFRTAHICPLLKVFSSSRLVSSNEFHRPASGVTYSINLTGWKPQQLETFVMTCGSFNLEYDDAFLPILERVKVVKIHDAGIPQDWIIKLLSSTSSLVEVEIPFQEESREDGLGEMPDFNLPSLISLTLARVPSSGAGVFFEKLDALSLQKLWIGKVEDPEELSPLESHPLRSLRVGVQGCSSFHLSAERSAYEFLYAICELDNLQSIEVEIHGSQSTQFCKEFLLLLTPKSSRAIRSGWKNKLVLPRLNFITIGSDPEEQNQTKQVSISVIDLASLAASRLAINRKVSYADVVLSSNGDYEASGSSISATNVTFPDSELQTCSALQVLDVKETWVDYEVDPRSSTEEVGRWLSKTVPCFRPSLVEH